jgi:hypothetical protein
MGTPSQNSHGVVLNSWKEIASYLGRGVRTVQRYERDLNLPVRRPRGTPRSAVVALPEDLDAWLRNAPKGDLNEPKSSTARTVETVQVRQSIGEAVDLRRQCDSLREAHQQAVAKLITNLNGLVAQIQINAGMKKPADRSRSPQVNSAQASH